MPNPNPNHNYFKEDYFFREPLILPSVWEPEWYTLYDTIQDLMRYQRITK